MIIHMWRETSEDSAWLRTARSLTASAVRSLSHATVRTALGVAVAPSPHGRGAPRAQAMERSHGAAVRFCNSKWSSCPRVCTYSAAPYATWTPRLRATRRRRVEVRALVVELLQCARREQAFGARAVANARREGAGVAGETVERRTASRAVPRRHFSRESALLSRRQLKHQPVSMKLCAFTDAPQLPGMV